MKQTLILEPFKPLSVNVLLGTKYHASRRRLKQAQEQIVGYEALRQGIAKATLKRRVTYRFTGWWRGGIVDPSNAQKVLEDNLVACGLLVDDSARWYEVGGCSGERSKVWRTVIELEDIET